MLKNILFVMLGGSLGAVSRYLVGLGCSHWRFASLPLGTFVVNVLGCFLMGILMGCAQKSTALSETTYLLLTVGFCGAFTTFSTFTADAFRLMDSGRCWTALAYMTLSIVVGMLLFFIGRKMVM